MRKTMAYLLILGMVLAGPSAFAQKAKEDKTPAPQARGTGPVFDPQSREILLKTCEFMKSQQEFSFKAEITDDELSATGRPVQHAFDLEAFVRRPDKLRVDGQGDVVNKRFVYDGKSFTLYDKDHNVYATADAPGDIEGALDRAHKNFNLTIALADLAGANLCEHISTGISNGSYIGENIVQGVKAYHFGFDKNNMHYQLWVETGDKPLIRKIVITQPSKPYSLQWSATITGWNFDPKLQDSLFAFVPPDGAEKIDFAPVQTVRAPAAKHGAARNKGDRT